MFRRSPVKREPYTTVAFPRKIGASSLGQSSGSYSRSASWIRTRSPVTCSRPVRIAAPLPRLAVCFTTLTVESPSWLSTCWVPSELPSSTITNSRSTGSSTARIRRMISTTVVRSLNTGTITESLRYPPVSTSATWHPGGVVTELRAVRGERALEPLSELDLRLPTEQLLRQGDVGLALGRVVGGERLERDLRRRAGDVDHRLGELEDRELVRVADVHRADVVGLEQRRDAADLVVHEAERPRLLAVAVHRERLAAHGLHEEVRHDAPVGGPQTRPEGIEDADDADVEAMAAVVREGE